jgi:hypothetical protein
MQANKTQISSSIDRFKQLFIPSSLKKLLNFLGYISLLGPPVTASLKGRANKSDSELFGKSQRLIFLADMTLRASVFLIFTVLVEFLMGNELYELLRIDLLFIGLIVFGAIHFLAYFIGTFQIQTNKQLAYFIYRIGRNLAYAYIPSVISCSIVLYHQYLQQIPLFSGGYIYILSLSIFLIAGFIGILQALLIRTKPCCI